MPLLLPPVIAALGLIATVLIVRTRYRVKHSLYTSARMSQVRQIERARRRALAARPEEHASARGESVLELTFGLTSLVAALGLVLMGVALAIGGR